MTQLTHASLFRVNARPELMLRTLRHIPGAKLFMHNVRISIAKATWRLEHRRRLERHSGRNRLQLSPFNFLLLMGNRIEATVKKLLFCRDVCTKGAKASGQKVIKTDVEKALSSVAVCDFLCRRRRRFSKRGRRWSAAGSGRSILL